MSTPIPSYVVYARLQDDLGHDTDTGVTSLSFSSGGSYLASGGIDGKVCVWNVSSKKLLHVVQVSVAVLSLDWAKLGEELLVCGLEDGTIVSIVLTPVSEKLFGRAL